jgi:hypothetical protein
VPQQGPPETTTPPPTARKLKRSLPYEAGIFTK